MSVMVVETEAMRAASAQFDALQREARELLLAKEEHRSAVVAEIAALHAAYNHHGHLVSTDFENLLHDLGMRLAPGPIGAPARRGEVRHILHVLTAAKDVGGDSRFVWRWIQRDSGHRHSVALTRQRAFAVPATLRDAVAARGGEIHRLDEDGSDITLRAKRLRQVASGADVVFLHVYVEDIVPSLAFAAPGDLPPIVFVMQADHQFVTGLGCSNLVMHMRASGETLSLERRGVLPDRLTFLPIPLDPVRRVQTREDAKQALGLPPDSVLLLSIARAGKFEGAQPPSFAEAGSLLLEKYPKAHLMVVGPADKGEWEIARNRTHGRLRALGERSDTKTFYEAADIYLDSYPFSSNTSLLEAGGHGVPLVSLLGYSPQAAVLGAGTPALDEVLGVHHDVAGMLSAIGNLIENPAERLAMGERTRIAIEHHHHGKAWRQYLEQVIARVRRAETSTATGAHIQPGLTDLDMVLSKIFGDAIPLGVAIERHARELPYFERLALLRRLSKIDRNFGFGLFLPAPVEKVLSPYLAGWRRWPLAQRLLGRT